MLPPSTMAAIKNWAGKIGPLGFAACLLFGGCTPPGPRALLAGKRLLDERKYTEAAEQLRTAVTLLATNAQAWNYLGLACQQSGQSAEAEKAYHRALVLDHDLTEAHYNLGCLWLEQNKLEAAKTEFTAFTLRRGNAPEGFLKLGTAQLRAAALETPGAARARELSVAEKSFDDALALSPQKPEGLNGLGLVRLQRGRAIEAAQYFNRALKQDPAYAPALLNVAIVSQQYLRDPQQALQKYREYLALAPEPANAAQVRAAMRQLEEELELAAHPPATNAPPPVNGNASAPKPLVTNVAHPAVESRLPSPGTIAKATPVAPPPEPVSSEVVKEEPALKSAQDLPVASSANQAVPAEPATVSTAAPPSATDAKADRRGFWQNLNPANLFHGRTSQQVTALPSAPGSSQPDAAKVTAPRPPLARYKYKSPAKPTPGNRADAWRWFAQGMQAQEANHLAEAIQSYRTATQLDAGFFEAYYNLGLAASEARNSRAALAAYEFALAIHPDSSDARYNFALLLKQSGYPVDAASEFEKVLVISPNEVRAHLALGNLYAQQLQQPAKARQHYEKVLEAQPNHPQAEAIRHWLAQSQPLG
jgi:tetratricopeptide (TPR) repeat protein